jgi:hypothetical protein
VAAGGLVMAWGVAGLLRHATSTVPLSWLRWLLGVLLAHDLLLAPALLVVGLLVRRTPAPWRPPLRAALIVSGTLALVSLPLLLGYGRAAQPGNRSVLPGNYPLNLAAVLAVVWATAAAWALAAALRRRTRSGGR